MVFFAHSENESGEKHLLAAHLHDTAKLMAGFANNDEIKEIFRITGLLHDFGKYQKDFQSYLLKGGPRGSVPHASWGAGFSRVIGMTDVSIAIDGHHKGLPDLGNWKMDTIAYKNREIDGFEQVKRDYLDDLNRTEEELKLNNLNFTDRFEREVYIRYIFSCLTDADWLDTENHFDKKRRNARIERSLDVDSMIRLLEKHFSRFSKKGEINSLRNETRKEVIKKSNLPGACCRVFAP